METIYHWLTTHWLISCYLVIGIPVAVWLIFDRWYASFYFLAPSWGGAALLILIVWMLWLPALVVSAWLTHANTAPMNHGPLPEPHPSTDQHRHGRERYFERPADPPPNHQPPDPPPAA